MSSGQIQVIEKKDGSYVVSGASISSIKSLGDDTGDMSHQLKEAIQKVDIMSEQYGKYLASKQYIDGFILFGIFFCVGLLIGRLLDGIFK